VPQRERPDTHKVTRGLREHMLDVHRILRAPRKPTLKKSKAMLDLRFQPFFCRGLESIQLVTKNEPEASERCGTRHTESSSWPKTTTVSQNGAFDPFKTSSKFTKSRVCHAKLLPKAPLILTHASQRFSHTDEKVTDFLHLSRRTI